MKYMFMSVFMMLFFFNISWAGELQTKVSELKERKDRISYSVGYQIGGDFKKQNTDIDPDAFLKGVKDALGKKNPNISPAEIRKNEYKYQLCGDELYSPEDEKENRGQTAV
jgi:FKBP-type peptidyl-prolyl cis-trans isomerase FklB